MEKKPISEIIKERIQEDGGTFFANHNISDYLEPGDMDLLVEEVSVKFQEVLKSLVIDVENDHNTKGTAKRVAKMYIKEIFSGRYEEEPKNTAFPNEQKYDQVYAVGPIAINSTCSHHTLPFIGHAYIGVSPGANVIGLSKFHRFCSHIARRPSIQEEMTTMIADKLMEITEAEGVAVQIDAEHFCVKCRGVKDSSSMVTSIMRGTFRDSLILKQEFMSIVSDLKKKAH